MPLGVGIAIEVLSCCISISFLFCNGSPVGAGIPMRDSVNLALSLGSPVGGGIGSNCVGAIEVLTAIVDPLSIDLDWANANDGVIEAIKAKQIAVFDILINPLCIF